MADRLLNNIPQLDVTPESYLSDFQNPINQFTCFREITAPTIVPLIVLIFKVFMRRNFTPTFCDLSVEIT